MPSRFEAMSRARARHHVANAEAVQSGLANMNPIYTWVQLAQRIPVRVHIDHVPEGVLLVAAETASVEIDPGPHSPTK